MGCNIRRLAAFLMAVVFFLGLNTIALPTAYAASLVVINSDSPGVGFNDLTAVAPVGGNGGTTLGAQRLVAFQYAANIWGGLLASAVPIRVNAQFGPLSCTATSATLGSAGPKSVYRDFAGALLTNTWYPTALANALSGTDFDPSSDDITASFNGNIGVPGCLASSGWYLGLDSNPPSGKIDFVSVLLHELGHGMGFLTFVNLTSGAKLAGYSDTFMRNLEDHGATPSDYPSMSDTQRVNASIHTGSLHWVGTKVRAASAVLTAGNVGDHVRMYAPNPSVSGSSVSHWDTALTPNQMMEPSYTGPLHNPVLELPLLTDIGWTLLASNYTLGVTKSGTGSGTVTSSPVGISCGATCSASFSSGTSVTLTAAPAAGSTFAGWTGGVCTGTGTCVISMSTTQTVTASFNALILQTISFTNPGAKTLGAAPFALSATGGASGNAVTFTSQTTGVCTVSGSAVTLVAAGTCTIAANQAGNASYAAASQVLQSFAVNSLISQTISFTNPGAKTLGAAPFALSATGGASGNAVTFTSQTTGVCTVSGSTVTLVAAGTCTIAANQAGNASYAAASQVLQSFAVNKASQTIGAITFSPNSLAVGGTTTASATATSALGVTFSSTTPSICTVSGSIVAGIAAGTCTIAADQIGNGTYSAATQVTQSTAVTTGTLITRYRLYSDGTHEHLYTTDTNEYNVLVAGGGWKGEGAIYKLFQGSGSLAGVDAVPYYRLYNPYSYQHHWTTDANEYNVLGAGGWSKEGVDGYILPTVATGSVPLYRLYLNAYGGLHLWTTDANEKNVLSATAGWKDEGVAGYVVPLP